MMYFLSKMVNQFLNPISLIWLVLLIACVRAVIKKEKRQALFNGSLALFITLVGSTKLPAYLLSHFLSNMPRACFRISFLYFSG